MAHEKKKKNTTSFLDYDSAIQILSIRTTKIKVNERNPIEKKI